LVDHLRRLYLAGTLRSTLHIANERRLLASVTRFPWDQVTGKAALEIEHPQLFQDLIRRFHIRAWSMAGVFTGSRAEVSAAKKTLKRALRGMEGVSPFFFLSRRSFGWAQRFHRLLSTLNLWRKVREDLEKVKWLVDLFEGHPSYKMLTGAHWRARGEADVRQDPLDSGAGLIWISPILPMTGPATQEVLGLCETVFHEFGFEFQATLSCVNERSLCAITSISFDRQNFEEAARAGRCEDKVIATLLAHGYLPYRSSYAVQERFWEAPRSYWRAIQTLKKAWDPQGMLSPGRYIPPSKD
jgi:4-cresol dehydrogenase (hydroxylating)